MTKAYRLAVLISLAIGYCVSLPYDAVAQENTLPKSETNCTSYSPQESEPKFTQDPYWSIRGGVFSPMFFGTLSSLPQKGIAKLGIGASLGVEYNFSSVFGIFANIAWGKGVALPNHYQYGYYVGRNDGYIYYPYTMIDGTIYHFPYLPEGSTMPLVGEGSKRLTNVSLEASSMRHVESRISLLQMTVGASLNLTRLLFASNYTEQPLELWMRPSLYLTKFSPELRDTETGKEINTATPKLMPGAGLDLALRYNINKNISLELSNQFIWESTRIMDGLRSSRKARDSWMWQPGLNLVYKFGRHKTCCKVIEATPIQPAPIAPVVEKTEQVVVEMPQLAFAYPEEVVLPKKKVRTENITLSLIYPVSKTVIRTDLFDNAKELKRLDDTILKVLDDPDYAITELRIDGFASPEGNEAFNLNLSKGRAESLQNYITSNKAYSLKNAPVKTGTIAENWSGLKEELMSESNVSCATDILQLLDKNLSVEALKSEIKGQACYSELLKDVYPKLRKSVCHLEYEVHPYTIERAKDVLKHKPQNLSPEEMYAVALSYGVNTEEGKNALRAIEKYHDNTDFGHTYIALGLLKKQDYAQALASLMMVKKHIPSGLNALGVAQAHEGALQAALQSFMEAERMGDKNAAKNVIAIKQYLKDIDQK